MKTITVRDLQKKLRECVDAAQKEHVVITRRGAPAAIVIGVEGHDWEDVVYQMSPTFWRMIEQRRQGKTRPMAEVHRRLEARWARRKKKA